MLTGDLALARWLARSCGVLLLRSPHAWTAVACRGGRRPGDRAASNAHHPSQSRPVQPVRHVRRQWLCARQHGGAPSDLVRQRASLPRWPCVSGCPGSGWSFRSVCCLCPLTARPSVIACRSSGRRNRQGGLSSRMDHSDWPPSQSSIRISRVCFQRPGIPSAASFSTIGSKEAALAIFGYPLTEAVTEQNPDSGQTNAAQYFERQRFELHTEYQGTPYEVELGRLGAELLETQGRDWTSFPSADPSAAHYCPKRDTPSRPSSGSTGAATASNWATPASRTASRWRCSATRSASR